MDEYPHIITSCGPNPTRSQALDWVLGREVPVATLSELAAIFEVDRRRVERWYSRRASTGFPAARFYYRRGERQTPPLWMLQEALDWRQGWTPHPGGAPIGNKNNPSGKSHPTR